MLEYLGYGVFILALIASLAYVLRDLEDGQADPEPSERDW